jgi:hypothetical protein
MFKVIDVYLTSDIEDNFMVVKKTALHGILRSSSMSLDVCPVGTAKA